MFKLDPNGSYMMPAHFGPRYMGEGTSGWYHDITSMVIPFVTDAKKLAAYLPAPFEVAAEPIVTVTYACNKNIDWLAGHGYNLIGVSAAVVYKGEKETLAGNFTLVIWENLTDPILAGRELQGIPKVFATIPEHRIDDGVWHCGAEHFGHRIVDMRISDLRAPTEEEISANAEAQAGKDNPMAWRYLPALGGWGPGASQFTTFPSETTITEALVGRGEIDWQRLRWEQNPTQFHIVNALAGLPVLEVLPAVVAKGSTNLVLPERPTRELV